MQSSDDYSIDRKICMYYDYHSFPCSNAIIPPIFENTFFLHKSYEEYTEAELDQQHHYDYTRGTNPTVEVAEKKLAALERGDKCKCFASGMAAISAAILNSVSSNDHILCIGNIYKSTLDLIKNLSKFGVSHSVVYSTSAEDIEKSLRPNTKLLYLESPTNTKLQIVDLEQVSKIAKTHGIRTIVDNTWATPLFQKPITFGIDIVVHSASKYLSGHSNLMGGALITSNKIMKNIFNQEYLLFGGIMSPHDASQLLRGLQTLPLRLKVHQENAIKIAQFLESHPAVAKVNYPGLNIQQSEKRKKQLSGFTGLLTFELKDANLEAVKSVINKVKRFQIGVSWGSFESLIMSPNLGNNENELLKEQISPGTIRLSVGMENVSDLINDLKQALI